MAKPRKTVTMWGLYASGARIFWPELFHSRKQARLATKRPQKPYLQHVRDRKAGKQSFPACGSPVRLTITFAAK